METTVIRRQHPSPPVCIICCQFIRRQSGTAWRLRFTTNEWLQHGVNVDITNATRHRAHYLKTSILRCRHKTAEQRPQLPCAQYFVEFGHCSGTWERYRHTDRVIVILRTIHYKRSVYPRIFCVHVLTEPAGSVYVCIRKSTECWSAGSYCDVGPGFVISVNLRLFWFCLPLFNTIVLNKCTGCANKKTIPWKKFRISA